MAAAAIGAPAARIVLGRGPLAGQVALPLDVDGRVIGRLELMGAIRGGARRTRTPSASRARWRACWRSRRSASASRTPTSRPRRCAHSDALKTALLRAVSHELRTPLTAIKAAVGALRGDQVQLGEEAVRELLEDVSIETDRLDRLVSDLLDVSRLQAGSASTALDWCEVDDLARAAPSPPRARAQPARTIEIETDDELPLVHCDASQIERVLVNLIENAAKFSPPGEPGRAARARAADDHVEISVIDHGPGIALDQRERVFEPFYRGRGGGAGGTGPRPRDRARLRRGQRGHAHDRRCSRWRHVHAHRAAEP